MFLVVMAVAVCHFCSACLHMPHVKNIRRCFVAINNKIQAQEEAVQAGNGFSVARFQKNRCPTLFLVHYFLLLCYTPLFIILLLTSKEVLISLVASNNAQSAIAWKLTTTVVFMNSSVNPFIYCWRIRELRVAVKRVLKEIFCWK